MQSAEEMLTSRSKSLSGVSVPFSDITDGLLLVIIINICDVGQGSGGRLLFHLGCIWEWFKVWNVNSSGD